MSQWPGLSSVKRFFASRLTRRIFIALGILLLLNSASFFTTVVYSHGDLPSGMYRLHIHNAAGNPVAGAQLSVYVRDAPAAPGYFLPTDAFVTGAQGTFEFVKDAEQAQADDLGWVLFWIYPVTPPADDLVSLQITAQGYRPLSFTEADLYKFVLLNRGRAGQAKAQTANGTVVDVNLYELDFTLHEQ